MRGTVAKRLRRQAEIMAKNKESTLNQIGVRIRTLPDTETGEMKRVATRMQLRYTGFKFFYRLLKRAYRQGVRLEARSNI